MTIMKINGVPTSNLRRRKLGALLSSSDDSSSNQDNCYRYDDDYSGTTHYHHHHSPRRNSDASAPVPPAQSNYYNMTPPAMFYSNPNSTASSPYLMSPWSQHSPYIKSPWIQDYDDEQEQQYYKTYDRAKKYGLIGSLLREEGHIYSLAATGNLLYTGSDSKNIRVWNKNLQDVSGFKSSSGLVKAIVVSHDKIFTGHPDGKIRVWKFSNGKYKRVGSLPTTRDLLMKSINPKNYVEVRRNHNVPWIKHYDAVSCMSIDTNQGLLYSGSWDRTFKVWRISDSRCIESIRAHEDAVNSVVVASDGLVFTGSADGTVKAWRRELVGRLTQHVLVEVLLKQDHALTSLAVSNEALYAGSSDGLVSFWERKKKYMTYGGVLRGHKVAVLCLAVGGVSLVMSGSADKSICVWRREGGGVHTCLTVLRGHGGPVKCIAVEKEEEEEEGGDGGWIIYSGSLDKSVKVWRVSGRLKQLQEE